MRFDVGVMMLLAEYPPLLRGEAVHAERRQLERVASGMEHL